MAKRRYSKRRNGPFDSPILWIVVLVAVALATQNVQFMNIVNVDIVEPGIVLAFIFVAAIGFIAYQRTQRQQLAQKALDLSHIDQMTGREFEVYVEALMRSRGYKTKTTAVTGDFGVDLIAEKAGIRTAVQIKRYAKTLGQPAIREAVAGKDHYRCTAAMVITNSQFSPMAKALGVSTGCELVDREELGVWIAEFSKDSGTLTG